MSATERQNLKDPLGQSDHFAEGGFHTTRWTLVLRAGDTDSDQAQAALTTLCGLYWKPLYAFVRRQGSSAPEAQDLTQGFFQSLLSRKDIGSAKPERGKFRSFLIACLKHFLSNQRDREYALKRGGGAEIFSLEDCGAEEWYSNESDSAADPDRTCDRAWAGIIVARVLAKLRREFTQAGRAERFDLLKIFLTLDGDEVSYAEAGRRLDMSESAVKSALHRMRRRYAELVRQEIADTVGSPEDIDDEIRYLFAVLCDESP